jgi:hypothetical protein
MRRVANRRRIPRCGLGPLCSTRSANPAAVWVAPAPSSDFFRWAAATARPRTSVWSAAVSAEACRSAGKPRASLWCCRHPLKVVSRDSQLQGVATCSFSLCAVTNLASTSRAVTSPRSVSATIDAGSHSSGPTHANGSGPARSQCVSTRQGRLVQHPRHRCEGCWPTSRRCWLMVFGESPTPTCCATSWMCSGRMHPRRRCMERRARTLPRRPGQHADQAGSVRQRRTPAPRCPRAPPQRFRRS